MYAWSIMVENSAIFIDILHWLATSPSSILITVLILLITVLMVFQWFSFFAYFTHPKLDQPLETTAWHSISPINLWIKATSPTLCNQGLKLLMCRIKLILCLCFGTEIHPKSTKSFSPFNLICWKIEVVSNVIKFKIFSNSWQSASFEAPYSLKKVVQNMRPRSPWLLLNLNSRYCTTVQ